MGTLLADHWKEICTYLSELDKAMLMLTCHRQYKLITTELASQLDQAVLQGNYSLVCQAEHQGIPWTNTTYFYLGISGKVGILNFQLGKATKTQLVLLCEGAILAGNLRVISFLKNCRKDNDIVSYIVTTAIRLKRFDVIGIYNTNAVRAQVFSEIRKGNIELDKWYNSTIPEWYNNSVRLLNLHLLLIGCCIVLFWLFI